MDSNIGLVLFAIAIVIAVVAFAVIIGMIVASVRSTRGGTDWSEAQDRSFIPWSDEDR